MPDYNRQSKADLQAEAEARGLDVAEDATKQELVNALAEDDRRQEEGEQEASVGAERDRDDAATQDQDQGGVLPPPAVQVGQGEHGDAAADALAAQARGDQPTSSRTAEQVEDLTGVAADDEDRRAQGRQMSAAEGVQAAEAGNLQVQQRADAENLAGYRGVNPDPTPNVAYTSEGRALDMPTPETDADAYQEAQRALRAGGGRFPVTESGVRQAETSRAHRLAVDEERRELDREQSERAQGQAQEARQGVQDKVSEVRQTLQR